jgi:hypothetical protein
MVKFVQLMKKILYYYSLYNEEFRDGDRGVSKATVIR